MKLTISGVRSFRGMEGSGFNCTLRVDGKPVAFVIDSGDGGCLRYEWGDHRSGCSPREKEILDWIAGQSIVALGLAKSEDEECYGTRIADLYSSPSTKLEAYVVRLVEQHEGAKRRARLLKRHVLFRREGKLYSMRLRSEAERAAVEAHIAQRHPDAEIVRAS